MKEPQPGSRLELPSDFTSNKPHLKNSCNNGSLKNVQIRLFIKKLHHVQNILKKIVKYFNLLLSMLKERIKMNFMSIYDLLHGLKVDY